MLITEAAERRRRPIRDAVNVSREGAFFVTQGGDTATQKGEAAAPGFTI
jgi:hypothetical protein